MGPSDSLHYDEVCLLRKHCGGALQIRSAQAQGAVFQNRAARRQLCRRCVLLSSITALLLPLKISLLVHGHTWQHLLFELSLEAVVLACIKWKWYVLGYIAGVFCAVVSQPADNLVSKLNSQPGATVGSKPYLPLVSASGMS